MDRFIRFVALLLQLEKLSSGWTSMRLDISGQKGGNRVAPDFPAKSRTTDRAALLACAVDRGSEFRQLVSDAWQRTFGPGFEQAVQLFFSRLPLDPESDSLSATQKAQVAAMSEKAVKAAIRTRREAEDRKDSVVLQLERVLEAMCPHTLTAAAGWHFYRVESTPHLLVGDVRTESKIGKFVSDLEALVADTRTPEPVDEVADISADNPF